jgi:MoaA/NifB/PqqE/SkfB family radical SAM enzyme
MKPDEKHEDHLLIVADVTSRCNYKCPYCYNLGKPDCPDFFSVHGISEWVNALRYQFSEHDLELYFTGGEVFIYKKFLEFLPIITNEQNVKLIRIDTNGSLTSRFLSILDPKKVRLMMTFHPTQVSFDKFLEEAIKVNEHGILEMVNYVAYPFEIETINKYLEIFTKHDIFLNVSWNINARLEYDDLSRNAILNLVTPEDAKYVLRNPVYGKPCLAGVCYVEMDLNGNLYRCHGRPKLGNLFDGKIELPKRSKPCRNIYCDCSVRYSLLVENSFPASHEQADYVNRNREHRRQLGLESGLSVDKPYKSFSVPKVSASIRIRAKSSRTLWRMKRKYSSITSRISLGSKK